MSEVVSEPVATVAPCEADAVAAPCALVVDLDGTLIRSDMLHESAMLLLRSRPLQAWRIGPWLAQGKAHLKQELAQRAMPDPANLPYRPEVLELLRQQRAQGRRIILATASDKRIAEGVAKHLGLFDDVVASDGQQNCSGQTKLAMIRQRLGDAAFDYMGNGTADLPLWKASRQAYAVAPCRKVRNAAVDICTPERVIECSGGGAKSLLRAMRPGQWVKNLLLFVPLMAAHKAGQWDLVLKALLAFAAFSLCASAVYVLNDMMDIEADRKHPRKRKRPFASGELSIPAGLVGSGGLLLASALIAILGVGGQFAVLLGAYLALTTAYTVSFKKRLLLDAFVLAGLYTLRIIAGGAAVSVVVSPWLLAFSMFLFLSLAFAKRYAELKGIEDREGRQAEGRSYILEDLSTLESCGPAAGYAAVLVFCLYISSDMARDLYPQRDLLWGVCPVLLYWITRVWFLAKRKVLNDDPIAFAARDRVSILAGILIVAAMVLASL